jgi:hypothetical protein
MIGFQLDDEVGTRLDQFRKDQDISRAAAVRLLVKEALDAREKSAEQSKRPRG